MPPDRLSALDATFLHVEDDVTALHVGSVLLLEGPAPTYGDLLALIGAKLSRVPRYRRQVRFAPLHVGPPVWVDDPHFHLEYHVRHTALPAPGGEAELRHLVGRLMSPRLDRARPLWEIWMVEGVAGGRWALVTKTHHALVDGVSGVELLATVLDVTPAATPPPAPAPWSPVPAPSAVALAAASAAEVVELPVGIDDPVERLRVVSTQMAGLKESGQAVAASALTQLAGFAPPLLLTLGARVATKAAQHNVNTVTTNVPGPQFPLYALGRKVERMYPYVPIGGQLRTGVAMFSYDGLVTFGVTGDYDTVADIDVLTGGIDAGTAELLAHT